MHEDFFGMRGLNLDQLQAFLDVVALGSFSAAADRAGLSQPAISLQVRQLERRFGVTLIERVGRKAQPTAAGIRLLEYADQIMKLTSSAFDEMARHAKGAMGRVRIGTGATACIYLLPPLLRQLRQRFPSLEITVSTGNTNDLVKAAEGNAIDVGLVTLPASSRALDIMAVLDDEFVVIAPRQITLPDRVDAATLASHPVILFEPGGNTRRIADDWLARGGVALKPIMSLGNVEAIKELVSAGLGCAVLPGMAVRTARQLPDLHVRPLRPALHRTLAIVVRKDKKLHRGLRETIEALKSLSTPGAPNA
ncbi:LysR family transcriptional regulator [Chelatococcus sp. SYSU_G07232]|uniref:LysR family transcriptional regulator n=1 Tax=Chelatococcus albus TaxID=3047466 RepID=A0ABT7ABL0_9HYPH|nr:LysR family transcriptional regulator [Chelatococcus sp. SYSU_G07232]MDJ1156739.1 LysR family transcriptional regulator [Chelatococcus sp. SYSU_G07232]